MTALLEHGTRCLYYNRLLLLLCPDRSVCILIETEKFSFSKMLRKELYLWPFAKKLYHKHDDAIEWIFMKIAPPKWRADCTLVSPVHGLKVFQLSSDVNCHPTLNAGIQSHFARCCWWLGQWGECGHCGTRQERSTLLLNGPGLRRLFATLLP